MSRSADVEQKRRSDQALWRILLLPAALTTSGVFFVQVVGRTWSLEHLKYHLLQTQGRRAAAVAFRNMESAIVETLLVASSSVPEETG